MANENKVVFGLKNVHYAVATEGENGALTFATPVRIPGAVSISLEAQGDSGEFYADDSLYYVTYGNTGYSGDLEIAKIPEQMLQEVFGMELGSTSKVLTEKNTVEPKAFALLFQIAGDSTNECYVMYNCKASRPAISSATVTNTKEPQTQTCSVTASPMADGKVFARTTAATPAETKTGWFTTVFVES